MATPFFGDDGLDTFGVLDAGEDPLNRACWSAKSEIALKREAEAFHKFDQLVAETLQTPEEPASGSLIGPELHLTDPCFKTFRKYVMRHPGWSVKRRLATEEEKSRAKVKSKIKRNCYWVDYVYDPSKVKGFQHQSEPQTTVLWVNEVRCSPKGQGIEIRELNHS